MYTIQIKPRSLRTGLFTLLIFNVLASSLACYFEATLMGDLDNYASVARHINALEIIYFVLHNLLAPMFLFYTMLVNNAGHGRSKLYYLILFLPAFIAEAMVLSNPHTHLIFTVENGSFNRQFGENILYIIAACYVVLSFVQILSYMKHLTFNEKFGLIGMLVLIIVGVVVQLLFQSLTVELWFEALAMLLLMRQLENYDKIYDNYKIAYNREQFIEDNKKLIATKHAYAVIVISMTNVTNYTRIFDEDTARALKIEIVKGLKKTCDSGELYELRNNLYAFVTFYRGRKFDNILQEIASHFGQIYDFRGNNIKLDAVIASAKITDDFGTPYEILDFADLVAQETTKNIKVIGQEKVDATKRHFQVEEAINRAIENKSFEVYYQPIWDAVSGKIRWAEALCRLTDEEIGSVRPDEFIAVAEHCGLIVKLGEIVFEKTCKFLHEYTPWLYGFEYVEVNLSPYQLMMNDTPSRLKKVMDKYMLDFSKINLEITESASLYGDDVTIANMEDLIKMKARFSLDDFGTGYSNVSYIINGDFENIKMDKSLLWDAKNEVTKNILLSFIKSFRKMNTNVIQEGVETKEQLKFIVEAGATKIQGFYFSKPLPDYEFIEYLKEFNVNGVTPDVSGIVSEKANEYKVEFNKLEKDLKLSD